MLKLLDELEEALMPTGRDAPAHRFLIAREGLRNHVLGWEQQGKGYQGDLKGTPGISAETNPVWVVRELLRDCSDTAAPATISELSFVDDLEYRARLREDVFTAESAFRNKEFKAATVMAGSVAEALLLLATERCPADILKVVVQEMPSREVRERGLEYASLAELVAVARKLKLFSEEALKAVHLASEFRNLIHPGKERRKKAHCNQATARSALAAMDHVISESERKFGQHQ